MTAQTDGPRSLERAREHFYAWARELGLVVYRVEYVATFASWDDGIGVYVFFIDDSALEEARRSRLVDRAREVYLEFLRQEGYPFARFPKVVFEFDSDENVRKNFAGSYFFRLR